MNDNKINLSNFNPSELNARLLCMLKSLPDIESPDYEIKARALVDKNLYDDKASQETIQNHFILFSIGKNSAFEKITSLKP